MKKRNVVSQNSVKVMVKIATKAQNKSVERQSSRDKTLENRPTCHMNKHPGKMEDPWYFVHI